eukprot:990825_1
MKFVTSSILLALCVVATSAFTISSGNVRSTGTHLKMSFYADSSDYKSSDSDFTSEEEKKSEFGVPLPNGGEEDDVPTDEETPVPMSKNSGNRFLALVYDTSLTDNEDAGPLELHDDRINLSEEHVMFCRKANLYNETFNSESMTDVIWSNQILSSDMQRSVGHIMCIESTTLEHAKDLLSRDPIVQGLTGGDISNIPLFRWRQVRDFSLRVDDGRVGVPNIFVAMDRTPEEGVGNTREEVRDDYLEYLIRSERVIAAGPIHLPTEFKDDPSSTAVGDFFIFNADDRDDAINFVEETPSAQAGLYGSMKVHRFNSFDVTGKFVASNVVHPQKTKHTEDMKEALEHWGYPVDDLQTKWLNW